jgi:type I restriction enzyme S subunit
LVDPAADITYGIVQAGPRLDVGVPYVRGLDIQDGAIAVDQLWKTSPKVAARYGRTTLRSGDVLLSIIRTPKVAIVPPILDGANINRALALLRPSRGVLPAYLAGWIGSPVAQSWLHERYRGIDMPVLNIGDVRSLPVPLAPTEEQDEVVRRLSAHLDHLRVAARMSRDAQASLVSARAALLGKACSGALTRQDPSDEDASLLIARLKAERSRGQGKRKSKPRKSRSAQRELRLMFTLKEISDHHLSDILRANGSAMDAKALWKASDLTIEDFYSQLKREIAGRRVHEVEGDKQKLELTR